MDNKDFIRELQESLSRTASEMNTLAGRLSETGKRLDNYEKDLLRTAAMGRINDAFVECKVMFAQGSIVNLEWITDYMNRINDM